MRLWNSSALDETNNHLWNEMCMYQGYHNPDLFTSILRNLPDIYAYICVYVFRYAVYLYYVCIYTLGIQYIIF
jgi:hypothetical protein